MNTKIEKPASLNNAGGLFYGKQKPLIDLIETYMLAHQVSGKKMAMTVFSERAGISLSTMTAIMVGNRWIAKCDRAVLEKLALFLEIPLLEVLFLSGYVKTEDAIFSANLEKQLSTIYLTMRMDLRMSFRAPSQEVWDSWPTSAKLAVCMMYQDMISEVLFRYTRALAQSQ